MITKDFLIIILTEDLYLEKYELIPDASKK